VPQLGEQIQLAQQVQELELQVQQVPVHHLMNQ
jgi:hypothetical protein